MTLRETLAKAGGRTLASEELASLRAAVPALGDTLAALLANLPMVGCSFKLAADLDESGVGVDMQWMDAAEMITEATEAYPGIDALKLGYVPVGECRLGSGNPYFVRTDGALVRIPHEAAVGSSLDEAQVELVASSVARFLELAQVVGA
jgi:hypothetical protein